MNAITQMTWEMVCEEDERAEDVNLQADWRLVVACLCYNGVLRGHMSNRATIKAWTMADGFGPGLKVEYIANNLEWDWSHIRDSSNATTRRIAAFLRTQLTHDVLLDEQYAHV